MPGGSTRRQQGERMKLVSDDLTKQLGLRHENAVVDRFWIGGSNATGSYYIGKINVLRILPNSLMSATVKVSRQYDGTTKCL